MGNYRFKFSDMIPNAWFYKLRDLSKQPARNLTHPTKKKLLHNTSTIPNPNPVDSPAPTSPSSSKDRQLSFSLPSHSHSHSHQRKSYYFTRHVNIQPASPDHDAFHHRNGRPDNFYDDADPPPRRLSKKRRSTRRSRASPRLVTSSVGAGCRCRCRSTMESVCTNLPPDSTSPEYPNSAVDTSSGSESLLPQKSSLPGVNSGATIDGSSLASCKWSSRLEDDIVIDVCNRAPARKFDEHGYDERDAGFDSVSKIELPPIKTKGINAKEGEPTKNRSGYGSVSVSVKVVKEDIVSNCRRNPKEDEKSSPQAKRFSVSSHSPGMKLRTNSPRIASRRIRGRKSMSSSRRRSLSESFAVVKSSEDPQRDFRDSMVEMILEHNIWSPKELEDLLACYLSLNSDEYHHLIITVFRQIWFDVVHAHLN